jgi:3',5'-cyclic-AMP phosphodiesterase
MRFVILGDLHYSIYPTVRLRDMREEFFSRLFRTVKQTKPDIVFAIGDVSHSGRAEEFEGVRECARNAGIEHYYSINGNHDLWKIPRNEMPRYNHNPKPGYFSLYFDRNGQLTDAENSVWTFLLMDTAQQSKHVDGGGKVDHHQLHWLKEEVAKSGEKPLFVLGHHPLRGLTKFASFPGMNIHNSKEVWEILAQKKKGQGFYFCGHNHANSEALRDNWLAVQTAAPLNSLDFRVVDVSPEEVEMHLVNIEGERETNRLSYMLCLAQYNITRLYARRSPSTYRHTTPLKYGEHQHAEAREQESGVRR